SRAYVYVILNREHPSAIYGRYTHHVPFALDLAAMQSGAARLVGSRDFAAWANETSEVSSTERTVIRCSLRRVSRFVLVSMEADGFLRGMVRNVVGTLLEV